MLILARPSTYLFWLPLTLLLAASTLNTKASGFAWLWFILAGLLAWWQSRRTATSGLDGEISSSKVPVYVSIARIWLITTAAALLLKTVPMIYWADPWGERHAEFRLLLGALGLYGLCQLPLERLRRAYLDANYIAWVGSGLAVACALALLLMLVKGPVAAPTNRIPWACSLAITACTLLTLARLMTDRRLRYFWLAGSFAAVLAVLASDVRGAYGLALVWPAQAYYLFKVTPTENIPSARRKIATLMVVLLVLISSLFVQRPAQRIQEAISEFYLSNLSAEKGANSSVGARLYLWQKSLEAIKTSLLIGHGRTGRMLHIQKWAYGANSSVVRGLGHVHNEYLESMMDHGLWGIGSFLSYMLGMVLMVRKLRKENDTLLKDIAAGVVSVLLIHATSGLSNVNFAHNYYPTALSLAITLLVCAAAHPRKPATQD